MDILQAVGAILIGISLLAIFSGLVIGKEKLKVFGYHILQILLQAIVLMMGVGLLYIGFQVINGGL